MADAAPDLLDPPTSLYDEDFCLWIERQVGLLRAGRLDRLDLENLIEELESMGRSEKSAIKSNMVVVLTHLLKIQFQPEKATRSWLGSIREHRRRLRDDFGASPSLRRYARGSLAGAHDDARKQAADETGLTLATFPINCPYSFEQVLDPDFQPEAHGQSPPESDRS